MNSHAPLLSRNSYSDRVTNASMLHELILTEVAMSVCDDDHGRCVVADCCSTDQGGGKRRAIRLRPVPLVTFRDLNVREIGKR
jgi:hypothetical protein